VLVILAVEDLFFNIGRHANSIILTDEFKGAVCFFTCETKGRDCFAMPDCIIKKIKDNFLKEGIRINFEVFNII